MQHCYLYFLCFLCWENPPNWQLKINGRTVLNKTTGEGGPFIYCCEYLLGKHIWYYGQVWTRNWRPGFTSTSITSLPIISAPALSLTTFIKANIHHVIHKEEAFSLPAMQTNTMYIQSNQRNYNPECWPLCLKSWSGQDYYYFDARFISHNNCKYKSIYSLIPNLKKSCNH